MKALKSDLAKKVMADPKAREQLRRFLVTRSGRAPAPVIELSVEGKLLRFTPKVVAKAS
ncbi:hypothetical protein [Niveibacterium terrae]|uniref:hypothetical protein n=1 Tax=Niveibacterium terrae TaxID=3373598 RepID=UPI003A8FC0B6